MMAQAKRRKASWMSSRISHRMRSRRNQCSRAKERIRTLGAGCPHASWKRLTNGDEADGHPFSLVSRIRGGPIGPSPPWLRG